MSAAGAAGALRGPLTAAPREARRHSAAPQRAAAAADAALPRRRGAFLVAAAVKRSAARNVACAKQLTALEGQEDAVAALLKEVQDFSAGRAAERGSGVLAFQAHRDAAEPRTFHTWELYESNAALGRHSTSATVAAFMERVAPLLERPVGMALYEWRDGRIGVSAVQGGPRGEGGLDDATGASGAAGGASYKQTSGAVDLTNVEEEEEGERQGQWGMQGMKLPALGIKMPWDKK